MSLVARVLALVATTLVATGCESRFEPTLFYGTWVLDGPDGPIATRTLEPRGGIFLADQFTVVEAVYVEGGAVVTRFGDANYNREPHPGWDGETLRNILFLQYSSDSPGEVPGIAIPEAGTVWYEEVISLSADEMVVQPPTLSRPLRYRRLSGYEPPMLDAGSAPDARDAGLPAVDSSVSDAGPEEPVTLASTLRRIEPATFTRGCITGRDDVGGTPCPSAELPAHEVTLTRAFWLMRTELTQEMWARLGFRDPSEYGADFIPCGVNCPVETITWWEALAAANAASAADGLPACYELTDCTGAVGSGDPFAPYVCASVGVTTASGSPLDCTGYRLPTEAEWEYAARGGESFAFAGAASDEEVAWSATSVGEFVVPRCGGGACTRSACRKRANAYDLCDLSGNVEEYVWDAYAPYAASQLTDPLGRDSAIVSSAIVRGGSWSGTDVRVARRDSAYPPDMQGSRGFRLARTAE